MNNEKTTIASTENIIEYEIVKKEDLSKEDFLNDILFKAYEKKLIDDKFLEKIYLQRLQTLQILLKYYTKDESSSVMIERAESVLKCINYTISIYLKQFETIEEILKKLKDETLEFMIQNGNKLIKFNVEYSRDLLKRIQKNKLRLGNYSYDDTIDYGIPLFFKTYDDFFEAHEIPGSIDYQLCIDIKDYIGIEFIRNYLERLDLENQFCHNFNDENMKKILKGYDKNCDLLLINIFEIILTNCLGLIICEKDVRYLNINDYDREIIKNELKDLSKNEFKKLLLECANKSIRILEIKSYDLINYINKCINKITPLIYESVKLDTLKNIFISFYEEDGEQVIEYVDKDRLSNSEFRKITDNIRESSSLQEKIKIINDRIKSLGDLNDMLDSECLFKDEYILYFKTLSNMQIILILKYIDEYGLKRDWNSYFYEYLNLLGDEQKDNICKIKNKIVII